ncbi:S8 family serine peptidase [Neobacillus sp. WH10]|uniref:S8 family serine peptidase n=1 Tax=Neobacillus sp. WH10 TaxID=3047873 RepID=UPI0024C17DAD|nr:S8 family serine peptidase [Neobacillus sp. WH10]WHY79535.1 S8 family serine peptidase [Neobacillus sp. WH10]
MKGIKRKLFQVTTVLALASSSIFGSSVISQKPTYALSSENIAENIIGSLSDEQRAALQKLDSADLKSGLRLSDDVDLNSDDEVSVIVEFKELPAKVAQLVKATKGESISIEKAKEKVEKSHTEFKKELNEELGKKEKSNKENFHIKYTYQDAFNGATVTLPANQIKKLLDFDMVKTVYSDTTIQIKPPIEIEEEEAQTKVDSIPFLKIDKLHKEGYTGKNIKIGVIDTGIDYNHPDLKEAFKGGYDFVDNDNDPMEATYAQWKTSGKSEKINGNTYYTDHGTHVSGTIAGKAKNNSDYKVTGVAPDSDLFVYRVLGPYGSGTNSAVIAGIDKSVSDGMNIINLSLGSSLNNPLEATSLAIDNAVLSGVTAIVAAGNSGESGMYTLGSPGAAALALTVGASSAGTKVTTFASKFVSDGNSSDSTLQLMTKKWVDDFTNLSGKTFEIVNVGEGGAKDYTGKSVQGKIAFVVRGTYALIDKMQYAKQNGAAGVIIYNTNSTEGQIPYYLGESNENIPVFSMTNKDGLAVNELFAYGTPTVTLGEIGETEIPGDELASFSSRGPSGTLYDIKPEITAPGVSVLSTVPSYINNKNDFSDYSSAYLRMSGTSMATPHVTGIAALLLQSHPDYTPADIKTVLMNTADPLKGLNSVFEVGAGRVDPFEAIYSSTELAVQDETPYIENNVIKIINEQTGGLSYGFIPIDNNDITKTTNLLISNNSDKMQQYKISVEYNVGARGSLDAKENGVSLVVPELIKIKKNSQETIPAKLFIPKTAKKGTYEGYIHVVNKKDPDENYQIPFGLRLVEEGFEYFKVHSPSISTNRVRNPYSVKTTDLDFKLNSPMQTLDFILVDPKTNQDLGLINTINTSGAAIDVDYYVQDGFYGRYFPFTGNSNKPIGYTSIQVPEGLYKIKVIGTNLDGKQYTMTDQGFIDNSNPTFTLDDTNAIPKGDLPFVELAPGQKTVTLSGSVIDNEAKIMEASGINVTQANNKVWYGPNSPAWGIPADKDGKFNNEISVDSPNPVNMLQFVGADKAGNTTISKVIYYVKPGTQYIYAKPNKQSFTMGDQLTYTFYSHGLQNAKDLTIKFDYTSKYFNSVVLNKNMALSDDTQFTVTSSGTTSKSNTINIKAPGDGLTGDIPLFDMQVDTNAKEFVNVNSIFFTVTTSSYKDISGKTVSPYTQIGLLPSYPAYSTVQAKINAEGLLNANGGFNYAIDYTTIGAKVTAKDSKGQVYNGDIQKNGNIVFNKMPLTEQLYTVIIDVPGHFTTYTPMEIGRKDGDIYIGESISYPSVREKSGDINKDNVIDIHDVILLQKYWGTNYRDADINFDGTVDAKDFKLLEANYLKQNDYVLDTPTAEKESNGKTIESIKKALGIN